MSAVQETIKPKTRSDRRPTASLIDRFVAFISSVRFGVTLLCILVVLSVIGMLIMQQNVQGFETYYSSLTPAEKTVYGRLGIFDIYNSWYFNFLLLILSLNIILASIDRWGSSWSYISKPKNWATKGWLLARPKHEEIETSLSVEDSASVLEKIISSNGLKTSRVEKDGALFVFGESGAINRLGAYIVHVFLLTLFLGHFVASTTGFDADVRMTPGQSTDKIQKIEFALDKREQYNVQLPFTIECTDIQQQLINPLGQIDVSNTLDWRTQIKIDDPAYGHVLADVSLNKPFSYRGYRFFQAQTIPVGNAREITIAMIPSDGGAERSVSIARNSSSTLDDGTIVQFDDFQPDFTFGPNGEPSTRSGQYNNPVAILSVTKPGEPPVRIFAFAKKLADNIPVGAPKLGFKWQLRDFEKAPYAHVLSIKYDPFDAAFIAWYIGGFGLIGALIFVFFFAHKRVWARIDHDGEGHSHITIAGEANRNQFAFSDRFEKIATAAGSQLK